MGAKILGTSPELDKISSDAEKILIEMLQNAPGLDDWTFIRGLQLANLENKTRGEGDLVLVLAGMGTFVLEVKGGDISLKENMWYSGKNEIQHPVKQAEEFKKGIHDTLRNKEFAKGSLSNTLLVHGVLFPQCRAKEKLHAEDPSLDEGFIADLDDCGSAVAFAKYIHRLKSYWDQKLAKQGSSYRPPKPDECKKIIECLCPNINLPVALAWKINHVTGRVEELEESQAVVLEGMQDNPRYIISGGGGTGKTVLAVSQARVFAAQGKRTGFFCFNKRLASHLAACMQDYPQLICGSFTEYMETQCQKAGFSLPAEKDVRYYREALPEMFIKARQILQLPKLEALVLDEAQDLMSEGLLLALDDYLEGSLQKGRWSFFMDLRQDIFKAAGGEETLLKNLECMEAKPGRFRLNRNYRNAQSIVRQIDQLFQTETKSWKGVEEGEVVIKPFDSSEQQLQLLVERLKKLEKERISFDDIVILSPYKWDGSAVASLDLTRWPLTQDYENRKGKILFSTIQGFKGLDSRVVILTNISSATEEDVLYTGMSRAIGALYVFMSRHAHQKWMEQEDK